MAKRIMVHKHYIKTFKSNYCYHFSEENYIVVIIVIDLFAQPNCKLKYFNRFL